MGISDDGMKERSPLIIERGMVARDIDAPEGNLAMYKASLTIMPHYQFLNCSLSYTLVRYG